ncbi:MAG: NADH-ubiquinone oxidoreductase chain G (EC [uncultured Sulfurovum sp.]|uniref:NADH-ubiquinone oxidoreductase chain G (EC) n=1 Tax=uncultured Sulfurovum sp. TaxID=269237 RepID=A0A6S6SH45_9BACT|nr:MAG: NADH-ubiquinone oxidoreductase chain G (EC [uncultured Sulfurovum sp.]
MSNIVNIVIDGKEVEAEKGAVLIDYLFKQDIDIPHFCYHPALGTDGNCRMCMVEIEGSKRPQISCDTPVKEGMVVRTQGENIEQVRRDILELELINHPVDCPTCDQAGECKLQDYYMAGGFYESRLEAESKVKAKKAVDLGKNVMLDQERCVLCTRCTRFTDEITHTNELGIFSRADHSVISTFPGQELESDYSMNIVDLCPVGALTSKDFRFNQRVWFLESFEAICSGCSKGCSIHVDHKKEKYKDDQIFRFRPREDHDVNGYFICDDGRLSYKDENDNRLNDASINQETVSTKEALTNIADVLTANPNDTLLLVSPFLSNEELALIKEYTLNNGTTLSGYSPQYYDESFADDMLRTSDRSPNRAGMMALRINENEKDFNELLSQKKVIVVIENSYFEDKAELFKDKKVILFSSKDTKVKEFANTVLPVASFLEKDGSYTNSESVTQHIKSGIRKNAPVGTLTSLWKAIESLSKEKA